MDRQNRRKRASKPSINVNMAMAATLIEEALGAPCVGCGKPAIWQSGDRSVATSAWAPAPLPSPPKTTAPLSRSSRDRWRF
jgi:hypothetical protein